jgi:hypothetical protein
VTISPPAAPGVSARQVPPHFNDVKLGYDSRLFLLCGAGGATLDALQSVGALFTLAAVAGSATTRVSASASGGVRGGDGAGGSALQPPLRGAPWRPALSSALPHSSLSFSLLQRAQAVLLWACAEEGVDGDALLLVAGLPMSQSNCGSRQGRVVTRPVPRPSPAVLQAGLDGFENADSAIQPPQRAGSSGCVAAAPSAPGWIAASFAPTPTPVPGSREVAAASLLLASRFGWGTLPPAGVEEAGVGSEAGVAAAPAAQAAGCMRSAGEAEGQRGVARVGEGWWDRAADAHRRLPLAAPTPVGVATLRCAGEPLITTLRQLQDLLLPSAVAAAAPGPSAGAALPFTAGGVGAAGARTAPLPLPLPLPAARPGGGISVSGSRLFTVLLSRVLRVEDACGSGALYRCDGEPMRRQQALVTLAADPLVPLVLVLWRFPEKLQQQQQQYGAGAGGWVAPPRAGPTSTGAAPAPRPPMHHHPVPVRGPSCYDDILACLQAACIAQSAAQQGPVPTNTMGDRVQHTGRGTVLRALPLLRLSGVSLCRSSYDDCLVLSITPRTCLQVLPQAAAGHDARACAAGVAADLGAMATGAAHCGAGATAASMGGAAADSRAIAHPGAASVGAKRRSAVPAAGPASPAKRQRPVQTPQLSHGDPHPGVDADTDGIPAPSLADALRQHAAVTEGRAAGSGHAAPAAAAAFASQFSSRVVTVAASVCAIHVPGTFLAMRCVVLPRALPVSAAAAARDSSAPTAAASGCGELHGSFAEPLALAPPERQMQLAVSWLVFAPGTTAELPRTGLGAPFEQAAIPPSGCFCTAPGVSDTAQGHAAEDGSSSLLRSLICTVCRSCGAEVFPNGKGVTAPLCSGCSGGGLLREGPWGAAASVSGGAVADGAFPAWAFRDAQVYLCSGDADGCAGLSATPARAAGAGVARGLEHDRTNLASALAPAIASLPASGVWASVDSNTLADLWGGISAAAVAESLQRRQRPGSRPSLASVERPGTSAGISGGTISHRASAEASGASPAANVAALATGSRSRACERLSHGCTELAAWAARRVGAAAPPLRLESALCALTEALLCGADSRRRTLTLRLRPPAQPKAPAEGVPSEVTGRSGPFQPFCTVGDLLGLHLEFSAETHPP